ncbi:MAG: hypothetical protein ACYDEX_09490 [Mobilitalea sp.]
MKRTLKFIGIILLCLIIPSALAFVPIGNNIILKKHTNELKNIKLNANYEILTIDSACGKVKGNGMQYFSAQLIHSKEDLKWENNDGEGVFLVDVNNVSYADFINDYNYGYYCKNIRNTLKVVKNTENYYVIYSFYNADLDSIWNSDLRAH